MKIRMLTKSPARATFAVAGRFDAFAAPQVADTLASLFEEDIFDVTVDLSETIFIDSTALAALVSAMKKARQSAGDLIIGFPSEPVLVILELTGLDKAFTISAERRSVPQETIQPNASVE